MGEKELIYKEREGRGRGLLLRGTRRKEGERGLKGRGGKSPPKSS